MTLKSLFLLLSKMAVSHRHRQQASKQTVNCYNTHCQCARYFLFHRGTISDNKLFFANNYIELVEDWFAQMEPAGYATLSEVTVILFLLFFFFCGFVGHSNGIENDLEVVLFSFDRFASLRTKSLDAENFASLNIAINLDDSFVKCAPRPTLKYRRLKNKM